MADAQELEWLLLPCMRWKDGKPDADMAAIGVVADWLEEKQHPQASRVRKAVGFRPGDPRRTFQPVCEGFALEYRHVGGLPLEEALVRSFSVSNGLAGTRGRVVVFNQQFTPPASWEIAHESAKAAVPLIALHSMLWALGYPLHRLSALAGGIVAGLLEENKRLKALLEAAGPTR